MPAIDHLVYAVPDLDVGVAEIAELTGVEAVTGGSHPGAGTRNALLSFGQDSYFEIISVDPGQPEPERPRPFGVDPAKPPRLASFAIHPTGDETIESIAEKMADLDLPIGPVAAMSRERPDGVELRWRLTLNRLVDPIEVSSASGVVPFVIDWGDTKTPAESCPRMGRLAELHVSHPSPSIVDALGQLNLQLPNGELMLSVGDPLLSAVVEPPSRAVVRI